MAFVKFSTGASVMALMSVLAASSEAMAIRYLNSMLPARRRLSLLSRRVTTLQDASTSSALPPAKPAVALLKAVNKVSSLQAASGSSTSIVTVPST